MLDVNPWVKIWTSPKVTIKKIVAHNPKYFFSLLCFIYGLAWCFSMAQTLMLGHYYNVVSLVVVSALLAFPIGYVFLSISTAFFWLAGKVFKGKADYYSIRAAVSWSNVPTLLTLLTWLVLIVRYGSNIFISASPEMTTAVSISDICMVLQAIAGVWAVVILVGSYAQVQSFSNWKSVGCFVIASCLWLLLTLLTIYILMATQQVNVAAALINPTFNF